MVLKPAAMHHDVACGSDTEKTELQEVGCGADEVSVKASATETARIDLVEAQEIWSYEEDMAFLAKASEKKRNRNWQYRENYKERTWQAWERVTMLAEDTNCWLSLPSSSQDAPGATPAKPFRSLREHVLQVARSYHSTEALSSSLPKTPEHLNRGPSPLAERIEPKRETWVYLEDYVIDQYSQKPTVEPNHCTLPIRKDARPRWSCYSRIPPRLSKAKPAPVICPPYGIQLITECRRSLQRNTWSADKSEISMECWSCQADPGQSLEFEGMSFWLSHSNSLTVSTQLLWKRDLDGFHWVEKVYSSVKIIWYYP